MNVLLWGGIATGISKCLKLRLKVHGEIKGAPFREHKTQLPGITLSTASAPRYPGVAFAFLVWMKEGG